MALSVDQAADVTSRLVKKFFIKSSEPKKQYDKFMHVRSTEELDETDSSLSGLGEADFVEENGTIMEDTPVQGYDKTYTQNMIGTIIPFTWKMWKYGIKKRSIERIVNELTRSLARKTEKLAAERLDNGFESTSYTHYGQRAARVINTAGGDGVGAFDDDHPREDGGANLNNIVTDGTTYNLEFGYAGLKAAQQTAGLFKDARGNPRPADLNVLVVKKNSANHFKAKSLLTAIKNGKMPESADNDGSGVEPYEILALEYLTDSAKWFMFDKERALSEEEGFQYVESQASRVDPVNVVFKTGEIQTKATKVFDLGHNDVTRSWVGSKGDRSNPAS